jgi:hypothetical protein
MVAKETELPCPIIPDIPNSTAFMILGCRRDVGKICGLLGRHVACSDISLPTFRDNPFLFLDFLALEDGTDRLSRNVCKEITTIRSGISQNRADFFFLSFCASAVCPSDLEER